MVLQKWLDYGFNGYQVPATPRATRSARRRGTFRKRQEDKQLCTFDLLATVAGNLLQEKDTSATSSNQPTEKDQYGFVKECEDANKPLKDELFDEGSCDRRSSSGLSSREYDQNCSLKEFTHTENDGHSGFAPMVTSSSCSERFVAEKLMNGKSHIETENCAGKLELGSSGFAEFSGCKLDGGIDKVTDEQHKIGRVPNGTGSEMCSFEDPSDEKSTPVLISSGGNAKLSGFNDNIHCSSLSRGCDNVPVVSRDDDENFSGCTHPSTTTKSFTSITRMGDRRIRKILASKYWKAASETKVDTFYNNNGELKPIYQSRKNCFKRQKSQMNIPLKKRKLIDRSSVSDSDRCIRSNGTCFFPERGMHQVASGSSPRIRGAPGLPSSEARQHTTLQSRDSHVKLRIKSFRVPELFIEIPETATIGSLKRTVMEAVTAILRGGLRVGVVLRGKKVRDDNKTLLQTGISHDNQLDALGFTLEPNSSQSLHPICAADSPRGPHAEMPKPLTRYPSSPAVAHQRTQDTSDMLPELQVASLRNLVESDRDSAPSPTNTSPEKGTTDSKALVAVPEMGKEALAVLPVHQKSKCSEIAQRRIRRPFSVAEVEALVQAVEKLGTGRWRDVKLRAFDNAKYRTYVDLKDKWKTLVHTARISPQQRRGKPVPQQLLDRVLTAHAYWSQQQTKQHSDTCLLL
ncbi:hypothetical protein L6164_019217 [Bauhinia variegata]|uniref:Uncharacterized protein n=1 Tax=Bauhinia variegata TaxID=167791 RepID=A0ACB9NE54_BAUVA|nr:hypothetical protein L6164_019217 [Bauhinia variegata]